MRFIPVTINYLEITDSCQIRPRRSNTPGLGIRRVPNPDPEFCRYLYQAVGHNWYWVDRLPMKIDDWQARFSDPTISLWVLELDGTLSGYFELEEKSGEETIIVYFGLIPAAVGKGFGGHLLTVALETAFRLGASRVTLDTCSLDHPHALDNYKARGMKVYKTEESLQAVPEGWPA